MFLCKVSVLDKIRTKHPLNINLLSYWHAKMFDNVCSTLKLHDSIITGYVILYS
jgi:hypothetical protein